MTIFRFNSFANLKRWQESDVHREWQAKLPVDILKGDSQISRMTGLEVWFTAPDAATIAQPPRYKMAIVVIAVIFIMLSILTPLFGWILVDIHPTVRMLIVVVIQVLLMTYVIMPTVAKLLSRWLSAKTSSNL